MLNPAFKSLNLPCTAPATRSILLHFPPLPLPLSASALDTSPLEVVSNSYVTVGQIVGAVYIRLHPEGVVGAGEGPEVQWNFMGLREMGKFEYMLVFE